MPRQAHSQVSSPGCRVLVESHIPRQMGSASACWQPRTKTFHRQRHSHNPQPIRLDSGPDYRGPHPTRNPGSVGADLGAGRREIWRLESLAEPPCDVGQLTQGMAPRARAVLMGSASFQPDGREHDDPAALDRRQGSGSMSELATRPVVPRELRPSRVRDGPSSVAVGPWPVNGAMTSVDR